MSLPVEETWERRRRRAEKWTRLHRIRKPFSALLMPGCNPLQDFPAVCGMLLLLASVALAKCLRPKALDHWNTVSGGSLYEIRDGGWWQLVTPAIVHADPRHFLYNALFFFAYGCVLESVVGSWPVVALFFGSHIVGFFLKLLINRIRDPEMYMFTGGLGSSRYP
jgi:membrane associated rhomboid family serine protease